jgi:hypothetical protein
MPAPSPKTRRAAARPFETLYSRALALEIVARVAEGESLASVCRDGRMPCMKTVYNWMATRDGFAPMLRAAQATARLAVRAAHVARRRARLARPKTRACPGGVSGYGRRMARLICERLALQGESLQEICAREGFPSVATVYNWLRAYPEFAAMYGEARAFQAWRLEDRGRDVALGAGPGGIAVADLEITRLRTRASHLRPRVWGIEAGRGTVTVRRAPSVQSDLGEVGPGDGGGEGAGGLGLVLGELGPGLGEGGGAALEGRGGGGGEGDLPAGQGRGQLGPEVKVLGGRLLRREGRTLGDPMDGPGQGEVGEVKGERPLGRVLEGGGQGGQGHARGGGVAFAASLAHGLPVPVLAHPGPAPAAEGGVVAGAGPDAQGGGHGGGV